MLFSTIGQGSVFVWMMAAGAMMAAWYALLAGVRRLLCAGFWLSLAADVAFGVGAAALFCGMLYLANYGQLRLYAALGALAGFALFAAGTFAPARHAAAGGARWIRHTFDKIRGIRWIKFIFR